MPQLRVNNTVVQVYGADPHTENLIYTKLSFHPKGYVFSPQYKKGIWDGYVRLYYTSTKQRPFGKFWTGNLNRVTALLQENNLPFEVMDDRVPPVLGPSLPFYGPPLRDFQIDAAKMAMEKTRGGIKLPTGSGKTLLAGYLMTQLNIPTVFIVQKLSLLSQAIGEFEKCLQVPIGKIQAQNKKLEKFNVATIQTLNNVLKESNNNELARWLQEECQMVIVDEFHHASSATHKFVMQRLLNSYYKLGLSATPHKAVPEDIVVESLFGRIIYEVDRLDLQKFKHLAKIHIFRV